MKKFLIILLIAVLCLSIFSCGTEEEANNNEANNNEANNNEANNNTPINLVEYKVVSAPMTNGPIVMGMAKDNNNNYYLLDLGYIKNVPLSSGVIVHYDGITPITFGIKQSDISEESVSNSLANAVSNTIVDTKIGNASFQINQSFEYGIRGAEGETSLGASYSREWGNSTENSFSTTDTYEKIETKAKENALEFTQTIGEHGEAVGYYKMQLMSTCDVFAVIKTNRNNSELESFSYYFNARDDITYISIYSENGTFVERADNKIDLPDDFYKSLPIPTENIGSVDEEIMPKPQYEKITTTMYPLCCSHDTWYDKSQPAASVHQSRHDGFSMGLLNIYGCAPAADSKYFIGDKESFAIRYEVLQDYKNLPVKNFKSTNVTSDDATEVIGTNIDSKVGYGAYWVRITYTDDSQTEYNKTDMFKNTSKGTVIDVVTTENIKSNKTIRKIEIVVVYEFYMYNNIFRYDYADYRCEYTYEFIG